MAKQQKQLYPIHIHTPLTLHRTNLLLDNSLDMVYHVSGVKHLYFTEQDMDETLQNTMLFDFYGELLTKKQQEYYDLYHNEDLSLSEIAESAGITKQGVYDIIVRAEKTLAETEQKTGIIQKWQETRAQLEQAITNGEHIHPTALKYFQLENNEEGSIDGI